MSTFEILARRIIVEARLDRYGVTPEAVLPWLVSRYQTVIGHMPMGEATRLATVATSTVMKHDAGTVSAIQGSTAVVGVGTLFTTSMNGRQIRISSYNTWFTVAYVSATQLLLDTPWPEASLTGAAYVLAQRYVTAPSGIRWITRLQLPEVAGIEERNIEWLNQLYPDRPSNPSEPQYWARAYWSQATPSAPRRVIELYPAPDEIKRVEFSGYANMEEPTLDNYPLVGINDQVLVEGGLANAFNYAAGQEDAIEIKRGLLDVASRHERLFTDLMRDATASDQRDMPQPHIVVVTSRTPRGRGRDSIMSAYDHVWSRP